MNYIDLILISIIGLSAFQGWKKGFIFSFIELINWTGSLALGFFLYPYISMLILKIIAIKSFWTTPLTFLFSVILARILLAVILNNVLKKIPHDTHQHQTNRLLGILPGTINGLIFSALLSLVISGIPLGNSFSEVAQNSAVAYRLTSQTKWIEDQVRPLFGDMVNETGTAITIHPETNKLIRLPFKVASAKPRPDLEAQMLILINRERTRRNLSILKADPELRAVARSHSMDMFKRGYFSHQNLDGKDPFDRIKQARIPFLTAGENLALSPNLRTAHTGLMESPGHKANILHRSFGRIGIGILDGGIYGIMITQNFRN
jgi:uncharacterized protein YkwD